MSFIDANVYLGRWPFRRMPGDEPAELLAKLRKHNVTQAWCGSFEALFHRDLATANERLAQVCREQGGELLVPFGSINPQLPDWEEDLRRCHEVHQMPGIRLHPNYHGYSLDDPAFRRLLAAAVERKRIVQLVVAMEDERTQSALARVPHVDLAPLAAIIQNLPGLRIVLLNAFRAQTIDKLAPLVAAGDVCVDIALLEGVGGVERLIAKVPVEKVLFGSHFPLFYFESAWLKLRESALTTAQSHAVMEGNARRLLA